MSFNHIGLFEGIGGFSLAAKWVGWKTVAWCEWNTFGQKVLGYHFPEAEGFSDITKTDFKKYANTIDIVTGGFPCQPYSVAGKRKGKEDERHLWPEMLRAIREIQPPYVVAENVGGLVSWNGGLVFNEVQADLEAEGYEVQPFILPACSKNAPHQRDRVWFIAYSYNARANQRSRINPNGQKENKERKEQSQLKLRKIGRNVTNTSNERLQRSKIIGSAKKIRENGKKQFIGCVPSTWQNFPTQSPICGGNDGLPTELDGITVSARNHTRVLTAQQSFSKWRNESIKAYGNAIVPQVALEIYKIIIKLNHFF